MKEISIFNETCMVGIEMSKMVGWNEVWFIKEWTKERVNKQLLPKEATCQLCTHTKIKGKDCLYCDHPDSPKSPENQMTNNETKLWVCPNWHLLGWEKWCY